MSGNAIATAREMKLGIGWRPELALFIDRFSGLGFVEIVAENFFEFHSVPQALMNLQARGVAVIPHGIGLSLGGAAQPDAERLRKLDKLAREVHAPLVSEHIAFVRANGVEAGHLLPVPRTREMLEILVENIRFAQDRLSVPLALENIATLFEWPENNRGGMGEGEFLTELLHRTGAFLLLDASNLFGNALNHKFDPVQAIASYPLERLAYIHVGGGYFQNDGIYRDSHAHAVQPGVIGLLTEIGDQATARARNDCSMSPGVMLERDENYPPDSELSAELNAIAVAAGILR